MREPEEPAGASVGKLDVLYVVGVIDVDADEPTRGARDTGSCQPECELLDERVMPDGEYDIFGGGGELGKERILVLVPKGIVFFYTISQPDTARFKGVCQQLGSLHRTRGRARPDGRPRTSWLELCQHLG